MKKTFNLLQSAHDVFTEELVKKISYDLEEEPAGVQKALEAIIPVVLYGLSVKASTRPGAAEVAQRATAAHSQGVIEKIGFLPLQNAGTYLFLLSDTFGFKSGEIINSISLLSGIKRLSVSSLISLAVPVVLDLLGKHKEMSETGLATLLIINKNGFIKNLPVELDINDAEEEDQEAEYAVTANSIKDKKSDLQGWRTGVLTMIASGIFLAWLLISGKSDHNAATAVSGKDTVQYKTKKDAAAITNPGRQNDH